MHTVLALAFLLSSQGSPPQDTTCKHRRTYSGSSWLQKSQSSISLESRSRRNDESTHTPLPIRGKSIYFVLIDRFARHNGNTSECGFSDGFQDNNWCNGTITGIIEQLDYIQGAGFDCIWISPIVEQRPGHNGASGYPSHGYWAKNLYNVEPHFGSSDDVRKLAAELHRRGMAFILDIVANHMGPVHRAADIETYHPFNKPEYYHQLDIGDMTFDQYAGKVAQALNQGAFCKVDGPVMCACYESNTQGVMVSNMSSGCPMSFEDSNCRPGSFACEGYNETRMHDGWFFDLGDLNQSHPFVLEELKRWVKWLKDTYMLDALRLDTAPYMSLDVLSALQSAAGIPVLGEVTASNMTYHASFQAVPPPGGKPVLDGILNFPLTYVATAAFCGAWFPNAALNLTFLGSRVKYQLQSSLYRDLDLLGNFMDNHDQDRLAKLCAPHETGRIFNSLAWTFFARGMPIMYYGTEVLMTEQRGSLWQFGFNQDGQVYQFVKRMNLVRRQQNLALQDIEVVLPANATPEQLILRRGGRSGTYALLNNYAVNTVSDVKYCMVDFPAPQAGMVWVDAIAGAVIKIATNCVHGDDIRPKILVQMERCEVSAMNGSQRYFYDIECRERAMAGCMADSKNQHCRYCGEDQNDQCPPGAK